MSIIHPAEKHYSRENLYESILESFKNQGIEKHEITREKLSSLDEFHVRGMQATLELIEESGITETSAVLDIGSGIGGPARLLADKKKCHVTGVDITGEFVRTANLLSELVDMKDRTTFIRADALELPFDDNSFDVAWTQHVQMNIGNKNRFYSEAARILRQDGLFIFYDIFSVNHRPVIYPVPWADTELNSFLSTEKEVSEILHDAGFLLTTSRDHTEDGIRFLNQQHEKMKEQKTKQKGSALIVDDAEQKFRNLQKNLVDGNLVILSGICRKV